MRGAVIECPSSASVLKLYWVNSIVIPGVNELWINSQSVPVLCGQNFLNTSVDILKAKNVSTIHKWPSGSLKRSDIIDFHYMIVVALRKINWRLYFTSETLPNNHSLCIFALPPMRSLTNGLQHKQTMCISLQAAFFVRIYVWRRVCILAHQLRSKYYVHSLFF